jgi:hypothetical protein
MQRYTLYSKLSVFLPTLHYLLCNSYQQLSPMLNNNWLSNINCCNKIPLGRVRSQSFGTHVCGQLAYVLSKPGIGVIAWVAGRSKYACSRMVSLFLSHYAIFIPCHAASDSHFHITHVISCP